MEDFRVLDNSLLHLFPRWFFLFLFSSRKNKAIDLLKLAFNVQMLAPGFVKSVQFKNFLYNFISQMV